MTECEAEFRRCVLDVGQGARVLELGTKRSDPSFPTHHAEWAPDARWTKSDFEDGQDVDKVADAHFLQEVFSPQAFDFVLAVATWEHLRWPWLAAESAWQVLAARNYLQNPSRGLCYVVTHQTFPIHGYPSDYFRFTTEGLASCMEWGGFKTLKTGYQYPAQIVPPSEVTRWNGAAEAFLNVEWLGVRLP